MARTKGKAKKAIIHSSSSSSPSLPPDLNRTPPTSPALMFEPNSPELSLSPPLSQIRTSLPPSPTKSKDFHEEVMDVQPLVMLCHEEVSTKETPIQKEQEEEVADEPEKEASHKEASVSSMEKGSGVDAQKKSLAKPKPKVKKAKSFGIRKSQRIIAGIGIRKTQSVDNTVHEIPDSDEEQNPKNQSEDVIDHLKVSLKFLNLKRLSLRNRKFLPLNQNLKKLF